MNLSPKGLDCFSVLSDDRVAYLDLTGSGNETSAHLAENGRITFMFCSYSGPPRIVRLYGRGRAVLPDDRQWQEMLQDPDQKIARPRQIYTGATRRDYPQRG